MINNIYKVPTLYIYICIADSICCAAKINTTLWSNWIPVLQKKALRQVQAWHVCELKRSVWLQQSGQGKRAWCQRDGWWATDYVYPGMLWNRLQSLFREIWRGTVGYWVESNIIWFSFSKSITLATVYGIDCGVEYEWHNQIVMPFNKGDL